MGKIKVKSADASSPPSAKRLKKASSSRGASTSSSLSILPVIEVDPIDQRQPSLEPARNPVDPQSLGIEFLDETQQHKFAKHNVRGMFNTKFASDEAMKEVGVFEGVKTLFANIGWQGIIEWDDIGYKRTTLEFLSSVSLMDKVLHFRLFNKACELTINQICVMIKAPTRDTFTPEDPTHPDFNAPMFWRAISAKPSYVSANVKASQIVHPTLRVAHRLLSCIIDSRQDSGGVTQLELYLLWCMINPQPSRPNFGHFLCHKLLQVANASRGKIFCSSVITVLGRHLSLKLCFPDNLDKLRGPRYLDMNQMMKMHMFTLRQTGHVWLRGARPYLVIHKHEQQDMLSFVDPVKDTKWIFERNVEVQEDEAISDTEQRWDDSEFGHPAHEDVTGEPQDHHKVYLARFTAIDATLAETRNDIDCIRVKLSDQWDMLCEISRTIASLRDHLGQHGFSQPPPSQH